MTIGEEILAGLEHWKEILESYSGGARSFIFEESLIFSTTETLKNLVKKEYHMEAVNEKYTLTDNNKLN